MKPFVRTAFRFVFAAVSVSVMTLNPGWASPLNLLHHTALAQVSIDEVTMTTIAGEGTSGFNGDAIDALLARLNFPQDSATYLDNAVLVADTNNHRVRLIDPDTGLISTFAGDGTSQAAGNLLFATEAAVPFPRGIAVDFLGNVYISSGDQIRMVRSDGIIDLFAGSIPGDNANGVPAAQAQFRTLGGLDVDIDGGIIVADILNHRIRRIRPDGIVVTLAGTGAQSSTGDTGPAIEATLNGPVDVAVHPSGDVYIAERLGNRIRVIRNEFIFTVYSNGQDPTFFGPRGLTIEDDRYLYFSSDDHRVRRLDLVTGFVIEVAGTGTGGFNGDGLPAAQSQLNSPVGLTLGLDNQLYITDSFNNRIREVQLPQETEIQPTVTPTIAAVPTPTPTVMSTPTSTPIPRTPIPTVTPIATFTPTATPTPFPEGQLAPDISSSISPSANHVFFTNTTMVSVPFDPDTGKSQVFLSSTPDGSGDLLARDTIAITVQQPSGLVESSTITFSDLGTPLPARDISSLFADGRHLVSVRLIDSKGERFSSSSIYVVVYTAPVLSDLPDIRLLTGESLLNAIDLDEYIYDQDTPLDDLVWSIEGDVGDPSLQLSPGNELSVQGSLEPQEKQFNIIATDGIFDASEIITVKVSSFRVRDFIFPDAPLMDDFAYTSPLSLHREALPIGINLADVPFNATFAFTEGIRAVHAAHGEVIVIPEFPGGFVTQPDSVAVVGQRQNNLEDYDGIVFNAASVIPPNNGNVIQDYNLTATSLANTRWVDTTTTGNRGEVSIGPIPQESFEEITDGFGGIITIDPGETTTLLSTPIELPPGPATISFWFAVEKSDFTTDFPTVMLSLAEDSSNLALTSVTGGEIVGNGVYQFLSTTYNVIGPRTRALIQITGTQSSGRATIYFDNIRVYPSRYEIDRALGNTVLPVNFDGTFETVLRGLGVLFTVNPSVTFGASAFVTDSINRTILPGGLNQSMILSLDEPTSAVQVEVGPNPIEESLYPRFLSARVYVQKVEDGGGFFALGLTNTDQLTVSFISNDRLPEDPEWHEVTTTGYFSQRGPGDPTLILQNQNIEGAIPGIILDGAILAVDDITLETFMDETYLWNRSLLPNRPTE